MISINGEKIASGRFPDKTQLLKYFETDKNVVIQWRYESEDELVTLIYLKKHLDNLKVHNVALDLLYIPNARMDRVKKIEEVFTLKYFCNIINDLNFSSVLVFDAHSSVSLALLNNVEEISAKYFIMDVIEAMKQFEDVLPILFFPDEGSVKRYAEQIKLPYCYGIKNRDWSTGVIKGLDVITNDIDLEGMPVLMIDDIISYGGSMYYSAKKLKELGAKNIYAYASHVENSILDKDRGILLNSGLVEKIYTTDSIFNKEHEKIEVFKI